MREATFSQESEDVF